MVKIFKKVTYIYKTFMRKIFFGLAVIGLIVGFIIHIANIIGVYIDGIITWLLTIGIFVVFRQAIILLNKKPEFSYENIRKLNAGPFYGVALKDSPRFLAIMAACFFFYNIIHFGLSIYIDFSDNMNGYSAVITGDRYFIKNGAEIIKEITESEYNRIEYRRVRVISGFWLMFYSPAVAILWPFNKEEKS